MDCNVGGYVCGHTSGGMFHRACRQLTSGDAVTHSQIPHGLSRSKWHKKSGRRAQVALQIRVISHFFSPYSCYEYVKAYSLVVDWVLHVKACAGRTLAAVLLALWLLSLGAPVIANAIIIDDCLWTYLPGVFVPVFATCVCVFLFIYIFQRLHFVAAGLCISVEYLFF